MLHACVSARLWISWVDGMAGLICLRVQLEAELSESKASSARREASLEASVTRLKRSEAALQEEVATVKASPPALIDLRELGGGEADVKPVWLCCCCVHSRNKSLEFQASRRRVV